MKSTKSVTALDSTTTTSAKKCGADKGITLIPRSPKRPKTPPPSITPEMRSLFFEVGLTLLTPEQRVQFFEYHRIRDERAKARSLGRAS